MSTQAEFQTLKQHLQEVIVGQESLLDKLMIALLTGGHVLLEGPPGLAKTTAVKTLATGVHASFQRIQFTPDLMPGDVMGSDVLDVNSGSLTFIKGPIFNEIVLADEINRAPPKVQSALLEAMAEKQVTAGGQTRALPEMFLVMATQNPLEQNGTYPLPEAQLDRFMLHIVLDYPTEVDELEILRRDRLRHLGSSNQTKLSSLIRRGHTQSADQASAEQPASKPAFLTPENVMHARRSVVEQHISEAVEKFMVALIAATRKLGELDSQLDGVLEVGASPRASIALLHAVSAYSWLQGRDYVTPDDVIAMLPDVLRHRLIISFSGRAQGWTADSIITRLIDLIEVPLES